MARIAPVVVPAWDMRARALSQAVAFAVGIARKPLSFMYFLWGALQRAGRVDCRALPLIFNRLVDVSCPLRHPLRMQTALDLAFSALADPTRRAILTMLLEDDMAVTDVAEPFAMSLAAISKHLQVLAEAGLISQEKRGRVRWCRLEPDAMRAASVWMQGFGMMEPVDLDAFERFLDAELAAADQPA